MQRFRKDKWINAVRIAKARMAEGTFREDLFYRLNVFPVQVPPLRERVDDIPSLVEYFVDRYAKRCGKVIKKIAKKTIDMFQAYSSRTAKPGRTWRDPVRRRQAVSRRVNIEPEHRRGSSLQARSTKGMLRLNDDQQKELIEAALEDSMGRVAGLMGAATRLGIPRQTLESKITSLEINKHRFKSV